MEKKGLFYFDPDDGIYKDHFPGNPVVPGSLIINAFITAIGWEKINGQIKFEQFRFKKFVVPGEYKYSLKTEDNTIKCRLYDSKTEYTTGIINL